MERFKRKNKWGGRNPKKEGMVKKKGNRMKAKRTENGNLLLP